MPKANKPTFNLRDPTLPPPKRKRSQLSKLTYKAHETPWRQQFPVTSGTEHLYKKFGNGTSVQKHATRIQGSFQKRSFRNVGLNEENKDAVSEITSEEAMDLPSKNEKDESSNLLYEERHEDDDDEAPPKEIDEFIDLIPQHRKSSFKKDDQISILPQATVFTKQREVADHRVKKMRKQALLAKKSTFEDVIDIPL